MLSNISFLLHRNIYQNGKTERFSSINNGKSSVNDCFVLNNKSAKLNIVSFKGKNDLTGYTEAGKAQIIDPETGEELEAEIRSKIPLSGAKLYCVVYNGEKLGEMKIVDYRNIEYGVTGKQTKCNYIYMSYLDTKDEYDNNKYKGVGNALVQAAIEESFNKDYGGRVRVMTVKRSGKDSPIGFYYSLGFRSEENPDTDDPDILNDKVILKKFFKHKKEEYEGSYIPKIYMYLPEEQSSECWKKIKKSPVLDETKEKLAENY